MKGWQEATDFTAEEVIQRLEPFCGGFLCTYVDKEGMMQGTDLDWFRRLRAATRHEITAAGGITTIEEIRELQRWTSMRRSAWRSIRAGWICVNWRRWESDHVFDSTRNTGRRRESLPDTSTKCFWIAANTIRRGWRR